MRLHLPPKPCSRWLLAACLLPVSGAWAYLGSFEEEDGYRVPNNGQITSLGIFGDAQFYLNNDSNNGYTGVVPSGTYPNTLGDGTHGADLTRYNAGEWGINNSGPGGGPSDIADNSGLWQALAGGRLHEDLNAPYYYGGSDNRNYALAYQYLGHQGTQVLDLLALDTDLSYRYNLDNRDFNSLAPSSTTSHLVTMSFWFCPTDWDDGYSSNIFGMGVRDDAGNTVMEIGYTGSNQFQYRLPGSSVWQTTAFSAGTTGWNQVIVSIDTSKDWASLQFQGYDDNTATLGSMQDVFIDTNLGTSVGAITQLQWDLHGGDLGAGNYGFKHYFDDFTFSAVAVPEPGSALLSATVGFIVLIRRKRLWAGPSAWPHRS